MALPLSRQVHCLLSDLKIGCRGVFHGPHIAELQRLVTSGIFFVCSHRLIKLSINLSFQPLQMPPLQLAAREAELTARAMASVEACHVEEIFADSKFLVG